ncbi:furry homolog-like protein [Tanacetum coccineum]|uniref:Furry homolog-like protein n=1 Tax=Tanacetum coccineum TaxID=301880 RepID=A0ABQ4WB64_9ASTR
MLGVVFFVHLPIVDQHILKVGEGKVAQCISGFTAMDVAPPRWSSLEKLWIGLENFVFHWLINADRVVSQVEYPSLVKTEGGLNASASFVAKANPLNRAPHKRKSELHHALCNMLSNILAPLADGRKGKWPPPGTAVASVGGEELLLVTMRSRKDGLFPWFWRKLAVSLIHLGVKHKASA